MDRKPLSQSIADLADAVERQAVAEGYADASRFVRPLMQDLPDGRIAVGAMDGFTALVRAPAADIVLTAGVDVARDRIEIQVRRWGRQPPRTERNEGDLSCGEEAGTAGR
ncbi:terminase gpA endonuclease subunit [Azospirillum sp. A26]|uniref:terminase gpA endonuclease subunit n=1 Tax=Azospirillum sp. A26 TaxID=3160607 RepID=UPI00366ADAD1